MIYDFILFFYSLVSKFSLSSASSPSIEFLFLLAYISFLKRWSFLCVPSYHVVFLLPTFKISFLSEDVQ